MLLYVCRRRGSMWIKAHELVRLDLVDFGPPDCDQTHMISLEPSIDDRNLISHSANHGMTRGCLRTYRWRSNDGNSTNSEACVMGS